MSLSFGDLKRKNQARERMWDENSVCFYLSFCDFMGNGRENSTADRKSETKKG